jgi:DNA-binding CsgD family transcriptional regulator
MIILSQRELVVTALRVNGLSNKQIAQLLHVGYHSVTDSAKRARKKFGVTSVTQLANVMDKPLIWGVSRRGSKQVTAP